MPRKRSAVLTAKEKSWIITLAAADSDYVAGLDSALRLMRTSGSYDEARAALEHALRLASRIRREVGDDRPREAPADVVVNGQEAVAS